MVLTVSFALSPGRRALLPPSPGGYGALAPVDAKRIRQAWRQTSGARTTRLLRPRTSPLGAPQGPCEDAFGAVSLRAPLPLTEAFPPCDPARADAVASTASRPPSRDDRDTPLLMGQDGNVYSSLRNFCQSEYLKITNTTPATANPSSRRKGIGSGRARSCARRNDAPSRNGIIAIVTVPAGRFHRPSKQAT